MKVPGWSEPMAERELHPAADIYETSVARLVDNELNANNQSEMVWEYVMSCPIINELIKSLYCVGCLKNFMTCW